MPSGTVAAANKASKIIPQWEKLARKGNVFTAFDSVDGIHWKKVGSATVKMNASVEIGMAVTSGNVAALNSSVFSDVAVTAG